MGKVSPKEKEPMALKQRRSRKARNRQSRTSSPAQHRFSRVTTRSCTDIGKKRILVLDSENVKDELLIQAKVVAVDHTPPVLSPERPDIKPMVGLLDGVKQQNFPGTPKTPRASEFSSESRLESLPMDLLVFSIISFFFFKLPSFDTWCSWLHFFFFLMTFLLLCVWVVLNRETSLIRL